MQIKAASPPLRDWSTFFALLLTEQQLKQGVTPHGLALTCGFALCFSVIPVLGTSTLLCFIFATIFRLNQPLIQLLNYIFYPLQFILLPLFFLFGEAISNSPHISINPEKMLLLAKEDWHTFLLQYGLAGWHAFLAWLLVLPIMLAVIYFSTRPIFAKIKGRQDFSRALKI